MDLKQFSEDNFLILDGAMGTMLQQSGLKLGEEPTALNITAPDKVRAVHLAYLNAGADMILTNTFGANARKISDVEKTIAAAVNIAKEAVSMHGGNKFVALDVSSLGELLEPNGALSFEQAYELFKQQIVAGVSAGVDAIFIETVTDLLEAKAAVLAAKENCALPVFCCMSFEKNMHTFLGVSVSAMALTLEGLGVDFLGINCSVGPTEMIPMVEQLIKWTNVPIIVKPNAGLPEIKDGKTVFIVNENDFAYEMNKIIQMGVRVAGGCCGTSPSFIEKLSNMLVGQAPKKLPAVSVSAVCSYTNTVEIDRVRIIGERINPTGKKMFQAALRENDMDYILKQGIEQIEAGADILDVNVGLPEIDEVSTMVAVVKSIQAVINAPLQIDSSNASVIEAALRIYNGKAVVNSVNGEDDVLESVLPIVKKYGAAVVGLTLDKDGIPQTAQGRFEIAKKIVAAAERHGIKKNDVYIDCLTLTSGAEQKIAYETLEAVSLVKNHIGVKTVLGVSNISFGLPERQRLNQVFLSAALAHGLDLPIINPNVKEMVDTIYCYHQLKNIDTGSVEYINRFRSQGSTEQKAAQEVKSTGYSVQYCVENGLKDDIKGAIATLLAEKDPLTIVNEILIPSLDAVGKRYESSEIFLPQLLQSAETAKSAFEEIKKSMPPSAETSKHKIVLATVQGDIHDIGKNIVKVVLENYGYKIIDLGRDVEISRVADEAIKSGAKLVGLSALMTTTVISMEKTIKDIKSKDSSIKVMVGGAVVTEQYAKLMGADYYAADAMAAVAIAKKIFQDLQP